MIGNITAKSDVPGTWTYHSTKKHAVTSAGGGTYTYTYDANGNAITKNGNTISWTSFNMPSSISGGGSVSSQFSYGPNRQRFKHVANFSGGAETTHYVSGVLEKVVIGSTTHYKHLISGPTGAVATYTRRSNSTEDTFYFTKDHQRSIDSITNASGTVQVRLSSKPFGERRKEAGWSGAVPSADWTAIGNTTRRSYTGHEMVDNLNLVHMNGRVQDPVIGRFLSADPNVPDPTYGQSFNRYSYVRNTPLSLWDPSGFLDDEVEFEHQPIHEGQQGTDPIGGNIRDAGELGSIRVDGYGIDGPDYGPFAPGSTTGPDFHGMAPAQDMGGGLPAAQVADLGQQTVTESKEKTSKKRNACTASVNTEGALGPFGPLLSEAPQEVQDLVGGMQDSAAFGFGDEFRSALGLDWNVNQSSTLYDVGSNVGLASGAGRLAYAGLARAGSAIGSRIGGEAGAQFAYSFRQELKAAFRLGVPGLARLGARDFSHFVKKYGGDYDAIIQAAGRTNPTINGLGLLVATGSIVNEIVMDCE